LVRASVAVSGESRVLAIISAERAAPDSPERQQQLLDQVRSTQDLANLVGGRVTLEMNEAGFTAHLLLPQFARRAVFLIDDNADAHRLVERYLAESPYRVVGTRDPAEAVPLAVSIAPHAILLDVMLPGIDGWELLGRLRAHPALVATPVVICTFLPQEPLALSLGAADFLRKPFSREALLESLGRFETLPGKTLPAAP
jgi:CheY-like chemotaxis protein